VKSLAWDRNACIGMIGNQIWSYVSPSSRFAPPELLAAAALLKWPERYARRIGELQFLLSDEVDVLLDAMPQLVRRLATASAREEQWSTERLHGPIQWNRTLALRGATGYQHLFVTSPAERVYQTPENELLVHVLDAIVRAAQLTGWDQRLARQEPAKKVRQRLADAIWWQHSRMLAAIDRIQPTPRALMRIRTGRNRHRYAKVLAAYDRLVSLVEQPDRQAIRAAIESAGLVTAEESTLFELLATFRVVDALRVQGWQLRPFYLFNGHVRTRGHRPDGRRIHFWYQTTPSALATNSHYKEVLAAHGFPRQQELRPDMILKWTDQEQQDRWLLIECKLRSMNVGAAARDALADLLSYRRTFDVALTSAGSPYGLGIAWGHGLQPANNAEVVLCTPDTLSEAIRQIVT
jgi:hypothetical protein